LGEVRLDFGGLSIHKNLANDKRIETKAGKPGVEERGSGLSGNGIPSFLMI